MTDFLMDFQEKAVKNMHNGCILNGDVGSGKSRTGLYYYYLQQGGTGHPQENRMKKPRDLYIITTARKRDTFEWEQELVLFSMRTYDIKIVVDSWNNIGKYKDIYGSFFIFDEDRVTGSGKWVKTFLEISRKNHWIILSATPGDCWMDYWAVFVANGYFKNKTEFVSRHVVYSRFTSFPQISKYIDERKLMRIKSEILVDMEFYRETIRHHIDVWCEYNRLEYSDIAKNQWNIYENKPIESPSECCYLLRHVCNSDPSRLNAMIDIIGIHDKVIVFYSFDYELEMLRGMNWGRRYKVAEWNGHKHESIPKSDYWLYYVQYTSGCEGWNCIETDAMIFYSQQYSYKVFAQACGRIDRMNTKFKHLYYYHLKSHSPIDRAIANALKNKKDFNERRWLS